MPAWLRNERVDFWLALIIGVVIGSTQLSLYPLWRACCRARCGGRARGWSALQWRWSFGTSARS